MTQSTKRLFATAFLTLAGALVVALAAALIVAYSGVVDVAADQHSPGVVDWFLSTTSDHSVAARADGLKVPALDAPGVVNTGAAHYKEMCATCHGAPGEERGEAARGLNPAPPDLSEGPPMSERDAAQAFWVIKHGIRMTGMPSFGKTHDDRKIWAIVALLKRLHGMTPAEYQKLTGPGIQ